MTIQKTIFPNTSFLSNTGYDYVDSFVGKYVDANNEITSRDICKAFFNSAPAWTEQLFEIRNKLVTIAGLKTGKNDQVDRTQQLENFECKPGERLGLFQIYQVTDDEVILGEDDSHLDFRISLLKADIPNNISSKTLTISTTVYFNNAIGKLYFLPVKPFHKLIVPRMLRGIIEQLGKTYGNG